MQEEIWKPVDGFDTYEVSNLGKVRNVKTDKILKSYITSSGLDQVTLMKDGKKVAKTVHRLVASHFLTGYVPGYRVEHKNDNRRDNSARNLKIDWYMRVGGAS